MPGFGGLGRRHGLLHLSRDASIVLVVGVAYLYRYCEVNAFFRVSFVDTFTMSPLGR